MTLLNKYKHLLGGNGNQNNHVNDKVMIVDGLNMFIRVFGAVPTLNDDGEHVGGVTGFMLSLGALIRKHKPTRVLVVFDGKGGSTRRKKLLSTYKSGRSGLTKLNRLAGYGDLEDQTESMKRQFNTLLDYLQILPIQMCYIDYVEADDVIAYAAGHIFKKEVLIVSSDKDFLQLVNDRISVYTPTKKKVMTSSDVMDMYGVPSHNLLFYRMFDGDSSDKIPGVKGIGPKTLINKLTFLQQKTALTLESLIENIESLDNENLKDKILKHKDVLELNYKLMQLSEPDISASIKSDIRNVIDSPIRQLNSFEFKKQFMIDKLYTAFKNIESWLVDTWSELNLYSKQTIK